MCSCPLTFGAQWRAQEVLLLLPLNLRRGKGSNADANAEDGARLTYLFVAALLKISSTPSLPFARRSKEGRAGEQRDCLSTSRIHWENRAGQSQCGLCRDGKQPWNSLYKGSSRPYCLHLPPELPCIHSFPTLHPSCQATLPGTMGQALCRGSWLVWKTASCSLPRLED